MNYPKRGGVGATDEGCMKTTPDTLIEDAIAKYPDLFDSRSKVLHHIFVVLGCGYDWDNGSLVTKYESFEKDRISREEARRIAAITKPIEHPYPWCDMCNLAKMPSDVTPEWKAAATEIRQLLTTQGYSFSK